MSTGGLTKRVAACYQGPRATIGPSRFDGNSSGIKRRKFCRRFLSRVKVLNTDIALPTASKGRDLRLQIKSFLAALNAEYRVFAHPIFTSQVVIQLLHEADELVLLSLKRVRLGFRSPGASKLAITYSAATGC